MKICIPENISTLNLTMGGINVLIHTCAEISSQTNRTGIQIEHTCKSTDMEVVITHNNTKAIKYTRNKHTITKSPENYTFVIREHNQDVWRVLWKGQTQSPTWQERGPAEAYLSGLYANSQTSEC